MAYVSFQAHVKYSLS